MTSVLPNEQHNLIVHYRNQLFVRSRISCWTRRVVLFIKQKEKKKEIGYIFDFLLNARNYCTQAKNMIKQSIRVG